MTFSRPVINQSACGIYLSHIINTLTSSKNSSSKDNLHYRLIFDLGKSWQINETPGNRGLHAATTQPKISEAVG